MEKVCQQKSVLMNELTFDQQNQLWEEAKKKEQEGKI